MLKTTESLFAKKTTEIYHNEIVTKSLCTNSDSLYVPMGYQEVGFVSYNDEIVTPGSLYEH